MLQDVLAKLRDVRGPDSRGWYTARCPFHNDRGRPNLGVTKHGYNCLRCGAKGSLAKLARHLGVKERRSR